MGCLYQIPPIESHRTLMKRRQNILRARGDREHKEKKRPSNTIGLIHIWTHRACSSWTGVAMVCTQYTLPIPLHRWQGRRVSPFVLMVLIFPCQGGQLYCAAQLIPLLSGPQGQLFYQPEVARDKQVFSPLHTPPHGGGMVGSNLSCTFKVVDHLCLCQQGQVYCDALTTCRASFSYCWRQ